VTRTDQAAFQTHAGSCTRANAAFDCSAWGEGKTLQMPWAGTTYTELEAESGTLYSPRSTGNSFVHSYVRAPGSETAVLLHFWWRPTGGVGYLHYTFTDAGSRAADE